MAVVTKDIEVQNENVNVVGADPSQIPQIMFIDETPIPLSLLVSNQDNASVIETQPLRTSASALHVGNAGVIQTQPLQSASSALRKENATVIETQPLQTSASALLEMNDHDDNKKRSSWPRTWLRRRSSSTIDIEEAQGGQVNVPLVSFGLGTCQPTLPLEPIQHSIERLNPPRRQTRCWKGWHSCLALSCFTAAVMYLGWYYIISNPMRVYHSHPRYS